MRQAVLDNYFAYNKGLEGYVLWMYLDRHEPDPLITTGMGDLVDPVGAALPLPWKNPDGSLAPKAQVLAEWTALKHQTNLSLISAWDKRVTSATTVRLVDADVVALVHQRLLANEAYLRKKFPGYDGWCADAQMAAHSMAWAVGVGWVDIFVNCTRSLLAGHFHEVTIRPIGPDGKPAPCECDINTHNNLGVVPRNAQNRLCFNNAQIVVDSGLDPEVLYWPNAAPSAAASPVVDHGTTLAQEASIALAEWISGGGAYVPGQDRDD
jgi:hypothetical protein